ncbi:hypothetical protein P3L10_025293 [Capsicum annuum]
MQKMQPFKKCVTGAEIGYCRYGVYRALLTPVHCQLGDHDNNDLLKRTRSIFIFHLQDSYYDIFKSELIHFKLLKVLELRHKVIDYFPLQILSLMWLRVIMGIQNVKKLRIRRDATYSGLLNNLVHLHQLETLSLTYCLHPLLPSSVKAFPATLKKLKLERTFLRWSYWDIIAELPNLAVLKLIFLACRGEEWHPNVKGFARLKLLLIEDNDVKYWKATNDNFPVIERLVLKECRHLKEIPIEFAEIHTLQLIELNWCLSELGGSATRIQKEQEDLGNNPLDVRISHPLRRWA